MFVRWRLRIRRFGRRIRRRLGLPAFSRRTTLALILLLIGLAFVAVTIVADFFMKTAQYSPQYYEPKDIQREEHIEQLEQLEKLKKKSLLMAPHPFPLPWGERVWGEGEGQPCGFSM